MWRRGTYIACFEKAGLHGICYVLLSFCPVDENFRHTVSINVMSTELKLGPEVKKTFFMLYSA